MKEYLPINLIVYVLYDETICFIDYSIGAQISCKLLKASKSLGNIHACFSDNLLVFLYCIPSKLYLFRALVIENHFIYSFIPISRNQSIILSWLEDCRDSNNSFF